MTKRQKAEFLVLILITILTIITIVFSCLYISSFVSAEEFYPIIDSIPLHFPDNSKYNYDYFNTIYSGSYGSSKPILLSNNGNDIASRSAFLNNGYKTIGQLYNSSVLHFDYIDNYTYKLNSDCLVKSPAGNVLFAINIPAWGNFIPVIDRLDYNGGNYEHVISFGINNNYIHIFRHSTGSFAGDMGFMYFFNYSLTDYSQKYDISYYYANLSIESPLEVYTDRFGNRYTIGNIGSPSHVYNWYFTFYVGLGASAVSDSDFYIRTYLGENTSDFEDIIIGIGEDIDNVNMLYNSFYNLSNLSYFSYTNYTYYYKNSYYNIIYNEGYKQAQIDYDTIDNSTWLAGIFNSFSSFFSIRLFGNVTVGLLLFIPLILSVLLFIFKLARG